MSPFPYLTERWNPIVILPEGCEHLSKFPLGVDVIT